MHPTMARPGRVSGTTTPLDPPPGLGPGGVIGGPMLVIRTRASSNNLAGAGAAGANSKARTAAWMKKLRRWRSKDQLWGCAGDAPPPMEEDEDEEDDAFLEGDDWGMAGLAISCNDKQLPTAPHLAHNRASYSSGTSSVRSSMRSSMASQLSSGFADGPRSRAASTAVSSPSVGSIASVSSASRADVLAKEQAEALLAMSSYMERSHTAEAPPSPTSSVPLSRPHHLSRQPSLVHHPHPNDGGATFRPPAAVPAERKGSLAYARSYQRLRGGGGASFSSSSEGQHSRQSSSSTNTNGTMTAPPLTTSLSSPPPSPTDARRQQPHCPGRSPPKLRMHRSPSTSILSEAATAGAPPPLILRPSAPGGSRAIRPRAHSSAAVDGKAPRPRISGPLPPMPPPLPHDISAASFPAPPRRRPTLDSLAENAAELARERAYDFI